jgi:hypothetical protein
LNDIVQSSSMGCRNNVPRRQANYDNGWVHRPHPQLTKVW